MEDLLCDKGARRSSFNSLLRCVGEEICLPEAPDGELFTPGRRHSTPLDAARRRSTPLDAARSPTRPPDAPYATRYHSMAVETTRYRRVREPARAAANTPTAASRPHGLTADATAQADQPRWSGCRSSSVRRRCSCRRRSHGGRREDPPASRARKAGGRCAEPDRGSANALMNGSATWHVASGSPGSGSSRGERRAGPTTQPQVVVTALGLTLMRAR